MTHVWTKDEVQIVKAAWATDPGRLALTLIVERICNLMGPANTDIEEGRRRVGIDLMAAINLPLDKLIEETHGDDNQRGKPVTATERAARVAAGHAITAAASKRNARSGRSKR